VGRAGAAYTGEYVACYGLARMWIATGAADDIAMANNDRDPDEQLRVVLADDDPLIVELVGGWLRDADFEVIEAFDGASALNACVANQPDLVVMDYSMPGHHGGDLATFIAAQTSAPLIFVSSHDETVVIDSAIRAGAYAYLVKPIEESQFLATVGTAMERGREMQALRAETNQLHRALEAGRSVNLATGLLMGRFGIAQRDAFERLRRQARSSRTKLEDVAAELLQANDAAARHFAVFAKEVAVAPRREDKN
jgi:AmiR/NasT family two-component response regulator